MGERCDVWWADLADFPSAPDQAYLNLNDEERARADRFLDRSDADLFSYRRALTRTVLGLASGAPPTEVMISRECRLCGDPAHGKPRLMRPANALEFSVSRTGTVVAIALTTGDEVGLDIEGIPALGAVDDTDVERAILTEWTRKESVLKAIGIGLALDPGEVVVSRSHEVPAVLQLPVPFAPAAQFSLREVVLRPDIVGHVAVRGEEPDVVVHHASQLLSEFGLVSAR